MLVLRHLLARNIAIASCPFQTFMRRRKFVIHTLVLPVQWYKDSEFQKRFNFADRALFIYLFRHRSYLRKSYPISDVDGGFDLFSVAIQKTCAMNFIIHQEQTVGLKTIVCFTYLLSYISVHCVHSSMLLPSKMFCFFSTLFWNKFQAFNATTTTHLRSLPFALKSG